MQSLTQPSLLLKPFAENGDKNTIPTVNTDSANPQLADLTSGFPPVTSLEPEDGGLPAERKDFNGLGFLTTTYDFFYQAGGTFTYNPTIASAIGGYPIGARLWYDDGEGHTTILKSTKGNNTDNFITTPSFIGDSWVTETPVLNWANTWTDMNTFTVGITAGGTSTFNGTLIGPTPSSVTDSSRNVATTEWVDNRLANSATTGKIDTGIMPNYAAGVSFSSGSTTSTNGWLKVRHLEYVSTSVNIDGVNVYNHSWGGGDFGSQYQVSYIPVAKGKVVTYSGMNDVTFFPCIGG